MTVKIHTTKHSEIYLTGDTYKRVMNVSLNNYLVPEKGESWMGLKLRREELEMGKENRLK
jgi:hypothetical protein